MLRGLSGGLVLLMVVSGCATIPRLTPSSATPANLEATNSVRSDPCDDASKVKEVWKRAGVGAVVGLIIGGALGFAIDILAKGSGATGAIVGGVVGGAAGAAIGYHLGADFFRRQCEIHRIAQRSNVDITVEIISAPKTDSDPINKAEVVGAVATLRGLGHFEPDSADLTPEARAYFSDIADQYTNRFQEASVNALAGGLMPESEKKKLREQWSHLRIILIGHTDDEGDPAVALELSQRRAHTVAELFRTRGVPEDALYYQGAGSGFPVADNRTEQGRMRNRRVEIVELQSDEHLTRYLSLRQPNPDLYRPLPPPETLPTLASRTSDFREPAPELPPADSESAPPAPAQPAPIAAAPGTEQQPKAKTPMPPAPRATRPPAQPAPQARGGSSARSTTAGPSQGPSSKAVTPPPTTPPKPQLAVDFGGVPASQGTTSLAEAFGVSRPSGWSWGYVTQAIADEKVYEVPCTRDDPKRNAVLPVKELKSDQPASHYKTGEYVPGLYGTSWTEMVNGHLVALTQVSVLRAGGRPVTNPSVMVFRDYRAGTATDVPPTHRFEAYVKTYQGSEGLLYRVYTNDKQVVACADIVFPYRPPFAARGGRLFYMHPDGIFVAPYRPRVVD